MEETSPTILIIMTEFLLSSAAVFIYFLHVIYLICQHTFSPMTELHTILKTLKTPSKEQILVGVMLH